MEQIFKKKLWELQHPTLPQTFAEALLGPITWMASQELVKTTKPLAEEQKRVIESLEKFAEEKAENGVLTVEGAEIVLKSALNLADLKANLSFEEKVTELLFSKKMPAEVKVLFVTEIFRPWEECSLEFRGSFLDELILAFPFKTAELFERMIGAMKLIPNEVIVYPIEKGEQDISQEVIQVAQFFKPEVVITLGAKATHKILKEKDRLSLIHGQFFTREIEGLDALQIVPLFHPTIIETNQNMKKTAWADMQKIMKYLRKI